MIPIDTDSSNHSTKSNPDESEKEVKLRNSDDYEMHTITEESEQVTQSDIKNLTPSAFSSTAITPNKRYWNTRGSIKNLQSNKTLFISDSAQTPTTSNSNFKIEFDHANVASIYSNKYIVDANKNLTLKNSSMFNIPQQLKQSLKNNTQPLKLKKSNSCLDINKSPKATKVKGGALYLNKSTIKKGKLLKLASPKASTKNKQARIAESGSKIVFPKTTDCNYLKHLGGSNQLNHDNDTQKSSNFLKRLEMRQQMSNYYLY